MTAAAVWHQFRPGGPVMVGFLFACIGTQWYYGRRIYRNWARVREELAWVYGHRLVVTARSDHELPSPADPAVVRTDVWMAVAGAQYENVQRPGLPLVEGEVAVWFLQPDDLPPLTRLPLPRPRPPAARGTPPAD